MNFKFTKKMSKFGPKMDQNLPKFEKYGTNKDQNKKYNTNKPF